MATARQQLRPLASAVLALLSSWPQTKPAAFDPLRPDHLLISDDISDTGGVAGSAALRAAVHTLAQHAPPEATVLVLSRERGDRNSQRSPIECVRLGSRRTGGETRLLPSPPPSLQKPQRAGEGEGPTLCSGQYSELLRLDAGGRALTVVMAPPADARGHPPQRVVDVRYRQLLLLPSIAPRTGVPGGGLLHESAFAPVGARAPVAVVGSATSALSSLAAAAGAAQAPPHATVVGSGWGALEAVSALLAPPPSGSGSGDGRVAGGHGHVAAAGVTLVSPHPVPLAEDLPRYLGEVLARRLRALSSGPPSSRQRLAAPPGDATQAPAALAPPKLSYQPFALVTYAHGRLSAPSPPPAAASASVAGGGSGGGEELPPPPGGSDSELALPRPAASGNSSGAHSEHPGGSAGAPPPLPLHELGAPLQRPPTTAPHSQPPLMVYTAATYDALQTARFATDCLLLAPRGGPLGRGGVNAGSGKSLISTQASPADWPLAEGPASISQLAEGAGSSGAGSSRWSAAAPSSPWIRRGRAGGSARAGGGSGGGNGLEIDGQWGGVAVTSELAASADGVWAAGHGVSWPDPLLGRTRLAPADASSPAPAPAPSSAAAAAAESVLSCAARAGAAARAAPSPAALSAAVASAAAGGHAAASAAVAAHNMLVAAAAAAPAAAGRRGGADEEADGTLGSSPAALQRYACLPVSYHALPPPLSLAAVVVGSCDPTLHSSHGYFWHTVAGGGAGGGGGGGGHRAGLGGARMGDAGVVLGRDRTGIGAGVIFFVGPPLATPLGGGSGGGAAAAAAASHPAGREGAPALLAGGGSHAQQYRVTGAVLWDARRTAPHAAPTAGGVLASGGSGGGVGGGGSPLQPYSAVGRATDSPLAGVAVALASPAATAAGPAPLAASATAATTAKATALIQRLIAGTRAQPLSGGPDGAAFALEAAAHAVLNAAMPRPGWGGSSGWRADGAVASDPAQLVAPTPQPQDATADDGGSARYVDLLPAGPLVAAGARSSGAAGGPLPLQLVHVGTPALATAGLGGGSATGSYSVASRFRG